MSENFGDERTPAEAGVGTTGLTTAEIAGFDDRKVSRGDRDFDRSMTHAEGNSVIDAEIEPVPSKRNGASLKTNRNAESKPAEAESYQATSLFSPEESSSLYAHWDDVQVGFVDQPREAVGQADALVASVIKRLAEVFAEERVRLEGQWDRGDHVSTEDLRLALRRYRSFFSRLLSV